MVNIKTTESTNNVIIMGILKELDVEEKSTADGRDYVSCKATVKVDQDINGKVAANEIPIRMFSMKLKKGTNEVSKLYTGIVGLKQKFTSLAACPEDQPELASKVAITNGRIEENMWADPNSGEIRTGFQISTNFMNPPRDYEEQAVFELSGVILGRQEETDQNGDPTGRLKVKFAVVKYNGNVDVINLIAESEGAVNHIQSNWVDGDTVNVNGKISINQSTKVWYEEQGFGEPIKRSKTETRRELIILGGSPSGLEEDRSYDSDDIKAALAERQARAEQTKEKAKVGSRAQTPEKKSNNFGF